MAKLCRDLRNYNTMFCILVGLHMSPVERLRSTWERLPNKYVKMSRDLAVSFFYPDKAVTHASRLSREGCLKAFTQFLRHLCWSENARMAVL